MHAQCIGLCGEIMKDCISLNYRSCSPVLVFVVMNIITDPHAQGLMKTW